MAKRIEAIDVENRDYHHLSQLEIGGGKRISQHLSNFPAGQCAAKKAGAHGCKFDTDGNLTGCGVIAVNDRLARSQSR